MQWANTQARLRDPLSAELLAYSRAALLRVADEYVGAEQSAGRRAGAFLGGSKLGFIGWSALFITGSAALIKVLTEPALKVNPLLQQGIWWAFLFVLSASLGALLASHSNNALCSTASCCEGWQLPRRRPQRRPRKRGRPSKGRAATVSGRTWAPVGVLTVR
jgi:hypothetical protein